MLILSPNRQCQNTEANTVAGFIFSVRSFICGLGHLDLKHVIILRKCRRVCRIRLRQNSLLNLFWVDVMDSKDVFLLTALGSYTDAAECITQMFSDSCAVG